MPQYIRNQTRVKPYKVQTANGPTRGRPSHNGFTPAEIVSCVLEMKRRALGPVPGATKQAVEYVESVFVDINGYDAQRSIYRDWRSGRVLAETMSDADLLEIVKPYIVCDK